MSLSTLQFKQIPGGWAAQQYGGRIMLLLCFASWSAASILTPTNARHTYAIVAARVAVGGQMAWRGESGRDAKNGAVVVVVVVVRNWGWTWWHEAAPVFRA